MMVLPKQEKADSKTQSSPQEATFGGAHIVHPAAFREKQIELDIDNASAGNLAKAFFRRLFRQIYKKPPGK